MDSVPTVDIKGKIPYPCCKQRKAMVKIGASGRASHQCPNCGQYVEFDYDSMTARITGALRGANKKFIVSADRSLSR